MKFKTLKHKTLPDTFGVFMNIPGDSSINYCLKPDLLNSEATMDALKAHNKGLTSFEQLNDYDLVEVELTLKS